MTLRRILSVLLCVCAVLSVMVVVAYGLQNNQSAANTPPPPTEETTTTATTKSVGDQIMEAWEKIKPFFEKIYEFLFQGLSKALVVAVQWLFSLVGLNGWEGSLF